MMRRITMAAVSLFAMTTAAWSQQWIAQVNEDPFRGNETIAMVAEGMWGLGFSCTKLDDLMLIFAVPEKHESKHSALLEMPFVIKVIVDDKPVVEVLAKAQVIPNTGMYRFVGEGEDVAKIVGLIASAKRRVAVAASFMGQLGHTKQFTVAGSAKALVRVIHGCKLPTS